MQLFGCPSTSSAPAGAFYGSKLSLLLAGRCVLGCRAVGCSAACDVWGGGVRDEGRQSGVGQGAWVVKTGCCGCLRWVGRRF